MKRILAPIDFSDVTPRVTETATTLGKALNAEVILLFVSEPEPEFVGYEVSPEILTPAGIGTGLRDETKRLEAAKAELAAKGVNVSILQVTGAIEDGILAEAERLDTDMIILGSHGHGALYHLLVGSVATEILKKSKKPVLIVK